MRSSLWICLLSSLLLGPAGTAHAGVLGTTVGASDYSGFRDTGNGLTGNQGWSTSEGGFKLSWNISQDASTMIWTYSYELRNADGSALAPESSHSILQLSESFALSDFTTLPSDPTDPTKSNIEVDTFVTTGTGGSNPGLPNDIYGVKLDEGNWDDVTFQTMRNPVWGNFYAKDGGGSTAADGVYVFNNGLASLGSANTQDFIPTPDTTTGALPEPASLAVWGFGMAAWGGLARRRRRRV